MWSCTDHSEYEETERSLAIEVEMSAEDKLKQRLSDVEEAWYREPKEDKEKEKRSWWSVFLWIYFTVTTAAVPMEPSLTDSAQARRPRRPSCSEKIATEALTQSRRY